MAWAPPILSVWFVIGVCTMYVLPSMRGGDVFGMTLPFWLVAAPLLDLVWTGRVALTRRLRPLLRRRSVAQRFQARRLCARKMPLPR